MNGDNDTDEPKWKMRAAASRAGECKVPACRAYGYCQTPATCDVACHAGRDGECTWSGCPQIRDNEPEASGRHCPMDHHDDQDHWVDR